MIDAEKRKSKSFWRIGNPIMWACTATTVFVGLIVWFGMAETCNIDLFPKGDCPPKWRHLRAAPFNEVGDTLAGIAGVLAFIWLIATVLLQSIELGEQRKVLALQKEEMEEQRKATQDMARSMSAQAKVFEDEMKHRDQVSAREEFSELVLSTLQLTENCAASWRIRRKAQVGYNEVELDLFQDYYNDVREDRGRLPTFDDALDVFPSMNNEVECVVRDASSKAFNIVKRPLKSSFPANLLLKAQLACALIPRLSPADVEKIDRSELAELANNLQVAENAKIWAEDEV
ncbi:MAG: hypothetical protein GY892_11240 [Shimia sp.]|nr:hypothetical protein [Shimia sp.]